MGPYFDSSVGRVSYLTRLSYPILFSVGCWAQFNFLTFRCLAIHQHAKPLETQVIQHQAKQLFLAFPTMASVSDANWLASWLAGCLACWLSGCLAGLLAGWLVGWPGLDKVGVDVQVWSYATRRFLRRFHSSVNVFEFSI